MKPAIRRKRALALRAEGKTVREIATALGVSHPTVIRDLRALETEEAEAVIRALASVPQPKQRPIRLTDSSRILVRTRYSWETAEEHRQSRRFYARKLQAKGATLRQIAGELGVSPATAMRDLRRDPWS